MTRLVGVRAVCDGCSAAAAAVFCVSHRNVLCQSCDPIQHNTLATTSHQRVDLSSAVTALPFCEHCDDAPATTYCESESLTLCNKCDVLVHEPVETPHWRTPIERTLRSRAVEFRESARPRQGASSRLSQVYDTNSSHHRRASSEKRQNHKDTPNPRRQTPSPDPLPSASSPIRQRPNPASAIPSQPQPSPLYSAPMKQPSTRHVQQSQTGQQRQSVTPASSVASSIPFRHNSAQQRRRPKPLAKRKRDMQRLSQQVQNSRLLDVPFSRTNILPTDHLFGYQPIARTSQPIPYPLQADLSSQQQSQAQPLQEPLLVPTDPRYLDLNVLQYENLDLSCEATAIEGLNGSGKSLSMSGSAVESGASSRRETPDTDMLPTEPEIPSNAPTQEALREVMASAVAAAGEQYLLTNASSGSRSSGERESPPVDMSCAPDPAGLVAAATAAAASAAAQAAAGVDLNNEALKGAPGALTNDAMAEVLGGRARQPRMSRRVSEPAIIFGRDIGKMEPVRETISDDVMQRLEIDTRKVKEVVMNVDGGECDQLVAQMSDGDDVFRRGEEMGYLEITRDDYGGVFDTIDLSQFEQCGSGGLGFGSGEFRPILDSDEG